MRKCSCRIREHELCRFWTITYVTQKKNSCPIILFVMIPFPWISFAFLPVTIIVVIASGAFQESTGVFFMDDTQRQVTWSSVIFIQTRRKACSTSTYTTIKCKAVSAKIWDTPNCSVKYGRDAKSVACFGGDGLRLRWALVSEFHVPSAQFRQFKWWKSICEWWKYVSVFLEQKNSSTTITRRVM